MERLGKLIRREASPAFWFLLAVVVVPSLGTIAAFGTKRTAVPVWLIVLVISGIVACAIAILLLYRKVNRLGAQAQAARAPHPHADLLKRIERFESDLASNNANAVVAWQVAESFNDLLSQTQRDCVGSSAQRISPLKKTPVGEGAAGMNIGALRVQVGQLHSIVESDSSSREPRTPGELAKTLSRG